MKKIAVIILILLLTGCGNKTEEVLVANKANLNEAVIGDKVIGEVVTSNTSVIYDRGITTFKTILTNKGEEITINNLNVKFKNKSNTEIVTLVATVNKTIKKDETTQVTVISDIDLTNAYQIEYYID